MMADGKRKVKKGDNMMELRNELKKSIYRLNRWEKLADLAQDEWDKDPMNEEREEAADHYYELQWREFLHAVTLLNEIADGKLTEQECKKLLNRGNREKIMEII